MFSTEHPKDFARPGIECKWTKNPKSFFISCAICGVTCRRSVTAPSWRGVSSGFSRSSGNGNGGSRGPRRRPVVTMHPLTLNWNARSGSWWGSTARRRNRKRNRSTRLQNGERRRCSVLLFVFVFFFVQYRPLRSFATTTTPLRLCLSAANFSSLIIPIR